MKILKFKKFESIENDFDFPTFVEVENYFYDFTDDVNNKIHGYQSGYKFYQKPHPSGENLKNIVSKKSNFIDILNTNIPDKRLEFCWRRLFLGSKNSNYCQIESVNFPEHFGSEVSLETIRGGAKAYKHLFISFSDAVFSKSSLEVLIECLKRLYLVEGFRPYGDLWTEDYIRQGRLDVEEKLGFTGLLVNCSDEEYIKMGKLIEQREGNKNLIKHFI